MKKRILLILFLVSIVNYSPLVFGQKNADTLTVTTYYPAPYAEYEQVRITPSTDIDMEGNCPNTGTIIFNDFDKKMYYCNENKKWQGMSEYFTVSQDNSYIYPNKDTWNLGIGRTMAREKLDVSGNIISTELCVDKGEGVAPSCIKDWNAAAGPTYTEDPDIGEWTKICDITSPDSDGCNCKSGTNSYSIFDWQSSYLYLKGTYACQTTTDGKKHIIKPEYYDYEKNQVAGTNLVNAGGVESYPLDTAYPVCIAGSKCGKNFANKYCIMAKRSNWKNGNPVPKKLEPTPSNPYCKVIDYCGTEDNIIYNYHECGVSGQFWDTDGVAGELLQCKPY